jgi:hypothetical protein
MMKLDLSLDVISVVHCISKIQDKNHLITSTSPEKDIPNATVFHDKDCE